MAEKSWLKSRFGDLSKLLGGAKRNTGPVSSTPFAVAYDNERKTPSAPPLPEHLPVRGEMGMPSKRFSLSEPNITSNIPKLGTVHQVVTTFPRKTL